jgi:hypothetical protein
MATKLSDVLEQESSGIMFPFRTNVKPVKTEQQVYTPTEGIMNVKGTAYEGPDATITYGSEEQGFPRQLKQIEKGMLPQFAQSQFPDKGMGKIETPVSATPTTPTQPVEPDKPIMDPCPPGFKLDPIKKICVPIQQQKSDTTQIGPTNPPRNIGPAANAVSKVADAIKDQGGLYKDGQFKEIVTLEIDNSSILANFGFLGKFIDEVFIKGPADRKFIETFGGGKDSPYSPEELEGIAVIKGKDGKLKASFNQRGKENFDNIATNESLKGNLASTQKKDSKGNIILAPNGQPMIVGPIRTGPFGTTGGYSPSKQSASYKIKDGKVVYDKPKKTFKGGTPKKGTGASGAPGRNFSTPSRTKRAAPVKTQIKSEKFTGQGFTRGR